MTYPNIPVLNLALPVQSRGPKTYRVEVCGIKFEFEMMGEWDRDKHVVHPKVSRPYQLWIARHVAQSQPRSPKAMNYARTAACVVMPVLAKLSRTKTADLRAIEEGPDLVPPRVWNAVVRLLDERIEQDGEPLSMIRVISS